ncbi:MAG: hypothetical protein HWE11_11670 [Gammaproteobacteria bacterium]|nr:hypothetical protein [Gammaproteobacteria bacterium]
MSRVLASGLVISFLCNLYFVFFTESSFRFQAIRQQLDATISQIEQLKLELSLLNQPTDLSASSLQIVKQKPNANNGMHRLYAKFLKQPVDLHWSPKQESNLFGLLMDSRFHHYQLKKVHCKTTICLVRVQLDNDSPARFAGELVNALSEVSWHDAEAQFVYLKREPELFDFLIGRNRNSFKRQ